MQGIYMVYNCRKSCKYSWYLIASWKQLLRKYCAGNSILASEALPLQTRGYIYTLMQDLDVLTAMIYSLDAVT